MRRALQKISVVWCARISSTSRGWTCGQMLARGSVDRSMGPSVGWRRVLRELGHVVDRDDDLELQLLARAGVDDRDRARPVGRVAAEEVRDLVERSLRRREPDALRRAGGVIASSRSRLTMRCAPRLVGAIAWISSMITYSTERSDSRARDVSIR